MFRPWSGERLSYNCFQTATVCILYIYSDQTGIRKSLFSGTEKHSRKIQAKNTFKTRQEPTKFITVIELSGVQFDQKSYMWFQNRTSAQRNFDLKSQVWFQTKIAQPEVQLPLYYIHFEIAQFNSLNTRTIKQQNLPNNGLFVFHFRAMWLVS